MFFKIKFLLNRKLCHSMTVTARNYHHVYQARSYLNAKYAAAYTLSQQGTIYDVTICNKILTQCTGRSNRTKLINLISDDGCDCSISWHYYVNVAEQHRQVTLTGRFVQTLQIQNMRVQGYDRAVKGESTGRFKKLKYNC